MTHIDDQAIGALTKYYAATFPESGNQVPCPIQSPIISRRAAKASSLARESGSTWRLEARHPPARTVTCVGVGGPCCAPLAQKNPNGVWGLCSQDVALLDICSSWISHYPKGYTAGRITGLGMNEDELKKNAILSDYDVRDLNMSPMLPYEVSPSPRPPRPTFPQHSIPSTHTV